MHRWWVLPLLLFASCQRHSQWQCTHVKETACESSRILYRSEDPVQGIDIEMIHTDGELSTYLQVHSEPLFVTEKTSPVVIKSIRGEMSSMATSHRGAQRVRLNDDLQTELISALKEGYLVDIELSGYRETIDPSRFQKVFARLEKKAPSVLNRIRIY